MNKEDYKEIWLEPAPGGCEGRMWCQDNVFDYEDYEDHPTKYVRADMYERLIHEINGMRCKLDLAQARNEQLIKRIKDLPSDYEREYIGQGKVEYLKGWVESVLGKDYES